MKLFLFVCTILILNPAFAQLLPLGLSEGLMGNSGVAASRSTAASYYNPSLLRQRKDNAFSMNGNTIGTSNSKNGDSTVSSSLAVSPSYLSSLIVGEDLVHELFLATTLQGQFNARSSGANFKQDMDMNLNRVISGYSMAFKSIPLALQVLGRYAEAKTFGASESSDAANDTYTSSKIRTEFKNLNVALGVSSHFVFDHYTLGINFNTRGWSLYNNSEGSTTNYVHSPSGYTVSETDLGRSFLTNEEGKLSIGHGFVFGDHEILTDSIFVEPSNNLDRYDYMQTFGYRYGSAKGHQVLCGLGHGIGSGVKYFGQSINMSVGYSWITRALRSAVGIYYSRVDDTTNSSAAGFIFGSEYEY